MITKYVTNTYEITDTYKEILLDAQEAKVKIEPSSDSNTKIVFFEKKRRPYGFYIEDNTLTIKSTKTKWYHALRFGINRSEIKLCVPKLIFDKITVKSTVGSVDISSITCRADIDITTNTGKVNADGIFCKSFNSKGNTGRITLNKLDAEDSVYIKRNTGKVSLNDCNSKKFFIKTNTGSVCGKLPTGTAFAVKNNTGKIILPEITIGEVINSTCEIKTNTGNVKFE